MFSRVARPRWEQDMGRSSFNFVVAAAALLVSVQALAVPDGPPPAKGPDVPARESPQMQIGLDALFNPRFHATGEVQLVKLRDKKRVEVVETFGHGAAAEQKANVALEKALAAFKAGDAPVFIRHVATHYRCPKRKDDTAPTSDEINSDTDSGPASDLDCKHLFINYTPPADPTTEVDQVECGIGVDVDVLVLGRRVKSITWELSPHSAKVGDKPLMRLLDVATDAYGIPVKGITFHDNNLDPRERGDVSPAGLDQIPILEGANTNADGQSVIWSRADGRRRLPKSLYYAVVMQYWSTNLNHYVYCKPYDPLVYNKGN